MLKQEKRRSAEAESALKNAGLEIKRAHSPILGRVSPLHAADGGRHDPERPSTEAGHVLPSNSSPGAASASAYVSVSGVPGEGTSGGSAGRGGERPAEPSEVSGRARAALKAGEGVNRLLEGGINCHFESGLLSKLQKELNCSRMCKTH